MVKIFEKYSFAGEYGWTLFIGTNIGLIILQTIFPRHNKWITTRLVCSLTIEPDSDISCYYPGKDEKIPIKNLQQFTHNLLMTFKGIPGDRETEDIIKKYKKEHEY